LVDLEVGNIATSKGEVVKAIERACGQDEMQLTVQFLHGLCSRLKLGGYHSKPKLDCLHILAVGKVQNTFYEVLDGDDNHNEQQGNKGLSTEARLQGKPSIAHFAF